MSSELELRRPIGARLLGRMVRAVALLPGRMRLWHMRRRHLSRPLPADWWTQFEREFRAYCDPSIAAARRNERYL